MKLTEVMSSIKAEYGLRRVCQALFFGAQQRLLSAAATVEGITRSINVLSEKFPDRAQRIRDSGRYRDALSRMDEAANYAATMHGVIETKLVIEPEFSPAEFSLPGEAQLKEAATFAGCSVEELIAAQITAAEKKFQQQSMAQQLASAAFYSAEAAEDCEVKAETVLRALETAMGFARTWNLSQNTLATMGLLRADIEWAEKQVAHAEAQPTHTGFEEQEAQYEALIAQNAEASAKRDAKRASGKKGSKKPQHA